MKASGRDGALTSTPSVTVRATTVPPCAEACVTYGESADEGEGENAGIGELTAQECAHVELPAAQ